MRPRPLPLTLPHLHATHSHAGIALRGALAGMLAGLAASAGATDLTGADGPPLMPPQRVEVPLQFGAVATATPRTTMEVVSRAPAWHAPAAAMGGASADDSAALDAGGEPGRVGVHVVRWAPAGAAGQLGFSVGFSGAAQSLHAPTLDASPAPVDPAWQPELGVRWRSGWRGHHRLDVAAWHGASGDPAAPGGDAAGAYNARVELQFRDAKRALGFDLPHGALGLQLRGGSKLMLRASHGGPMLYYRNQW
jgi:hypothetical protein